MAWSRLKQQVGIFFGLAMFCSLAVHGTDFAAADSLCCMGMVATLDASRLSRVRYIVLLAVAVVYRLALAVSRELTGGLQLQFELL